MNGITYTLAVFATLGAIDRIFGNRFGLGKEFERGFELLGALVFAMLGMMVVSPVIASLIRPALEALPLEPSAIIGALFACDNGGAPLCLEVARDTSLGYFNGLVVASMMGCTVCFTIPFSLSVVEKKHHQEVLLGLLCGIITIPVGCFAAGLFLGIPIGTLLLDLLPLIVFSLLIGFGLWKFPDKAVKLFAVFGEFIKVILAVGLWLSVFKVLTGIEILPGMASVEENAWIIFYSAVVMTGAFPLIYIVSRILKKPLSLLGKKLSVSTESVTGLLSTLGTSITTFGNMKDMDKKGIVLNSAFAVSAAFVFTDHMAFTMAFEESFVGGVIFGKLISAVPAVLLAAVIYKKVNTQKDEGEWK